MRVNVPVALMKVFGGKGTYRENYWIYLTGSQNCHYFQEPIHVFFCVTSPLSKQYFGNVDFLMAQYQNRTVGFSLSSERNR